MLCIHGICQNWINFIKSSRTPNIPSIVLLLLQQAWNNENRNDHQHLIEIYKKICLTINRSYDKTKHHLPSKAHKCRNKQKLHKIKWPFNKTIYYHIDHHIDHQIDPFRLAFVFDLFSFSYAIEIGRLKYDFPTKFIILKESNNNYQLIWCNCFFTLNLIRSSLLCNVLHVQSIPFDRMQNEYGQDNFLADSLSNVCVFVHTTNDKALR